MAKQENSITKGFSAKKTSSQSPKKREREGEQHKSVKTAFLFKKNRSERNTLTYQKRRWGTMNLQEKETAPADSVPPRNERKERTLSRTYQRGLASSDKEVKPAAEQALNQTM